MPTTVNKAEFPNYWWHWQDWPVPTMPDIPAAEVPWGWDTKAFWRQDATGKPVDAARTAALKAVDVPVGVAAGGPPWAGSTYGMPYHLFDPQTRPKSVTRMLDTSREPTYGPWRFQSYFPFIGRDVQYATEAVPLPNVLRREGDPGNSSDAHAYLVDTPMSALWELYQAQHPGWTLAPGVEWTVSHSGGGRGVVRWDTSKSWLEPGQPMHGVVATGVPQFPMIGRFDEVLAMKPGATTGLGHVMFGVLPNYNPKIEGMARASDGSSKAHPVYGGTILRMKREVALGVPAASVARIVADTWSSHGWFQGDRNAWGKADTDGVGGSPLSMDRRWYAGTPTIKGLRDVPMHTILGGVKRPILLSDFEVIVANS